MVRPKYNFGSVFKAHSLVVQEKSTNAHLTSITYVDEPNIRVNASDSIKPQGHDKGIYGGSHNKNCSKYFTYCNLHGHTIDFCYQKHGPSHFNNSNSSINASNCEVSEINNAT